MRWTRYARTDELEAIAAECPEAAFELHIRAMHAIGMEFNRAMCSPVWPEPPHHSAKFLSAYADSFAA